MVRAGGVPAAAAAAATVEASRGGRVSGRVLGHGCVVSGRGICSYIYMYL